ncbi:MAG: biotin/lipoyl-binding protein [Candidatus Thiodiazotropha sp. (ex Lucinoma aequizonata)]|nr:biotin/lipoyl-binding protein [Candidatus Thiodiazotropha sp. (ex Lucinoma aequizonata)]MCU7914055.1 biotin/lipoyl-binding protein [Candidatus Thiodiazotropha sp. (ex Lucinoma aequizonata)]
MLLLDLAEEVALIEEFSITGSLISTRIAKLSTEMSGIVESMVVEIGDQVRAGDEILQLNSELDRLFLAAVRAATEKAILELNPAAL